MKGLLWIVILLVASNGLCYILTRNAYRVNVNRTEIGIDRKGAFDVNHLKEIPFLADVLKRDPDALGSKWNGAQCPVAFENPDQAIKFFATFNVEYSVKIINDLVFVVRWLDPASSFSALCAAVYVKPMNPGAARYLCCVQYRLKANGPNDPFSLKVINCEDGENVLLPLHGNNNGPHTKPEAEAELGGNEVGFHVGRALRDYVGDCRCGKPDPEALKKTLFGLICNKETATHNGAWPIAVQFPTLLSK